MTRKHGILAGGAAAGLIVAGIVAAVAVQDRGPAPNSQQDYEREIPPTLLTWREVGQVDTGLESPRGLAVAHGRAYVGGDGLVRVLDLAAGKVVRDFSVSGRVGCVAVWDGTLYAGLPHAVKARRLHVDGAGASGVRPGWELVSDLAGGYLVTGISVGSGGVAVSAWHRETREGAVRWHEASGEPVGTAEGFMVPSAYFPLVWAPAGEGDGQWLRVGHTGMRLVEAYDGRRRMRFEWGESSPEAAGFAGCCNPVSLAAFSDGRIVTAEKALPTVKVFHADTGDRRGELASVVAGPDAFETQRNAAARGEMDRVGLDVAVEDGRIYVLDRATCEVRVFELR